ncbi:MAG: ester cyclase [Anaerolineae bacterium]|nr:ester cyclase [Anaerolineae bacterium]
MPDDTLASVRRLFEECFNTGDMHLADEMIAPNYVDYSTMAAPAPGVEGFKQRILNLRKTFPDARFTVEEIFADGDKVAFRWVVRGTDTGGFMGRPPSGNAVTVTGINIEHMVNGKIAEHWSAPDNLSMMRQLGMIP